MPQSKLPLVAYRHNQDTPALTWTITHGQKTYPAVDVYIDVDGTVQKILPNSVTYVDENTVSVSFSQARAGFATVVL